MLMKLEVEELAWWDVYKTLHEVGIASQDVVSESIGDVYDTEDIFVPCSAGDHVFTVSGVTVTEDRILRFLDKAKILVNRGDVKIIRIGQA